MSHVKLAVRLLDLRLVSDACLVCDRGDGNTPR